jgi:hypothetical protein
MQALVKKCDCGFCILFLILDYEDLTFCFENLVDLGIDVP